MIPSLLSRYDVMNGQTGNNTEMTDAIRRLLLNQNNNRKQQGNVAPALLQRAMVRGQAAGTLPALDIPPAGPEPPTTAPFPGGGSPIVEVPTGPPDAPLPSRGGTIATMPAPTPAADSAATPGTPRELPWGESLLQALLGMGSRGMLTQIAPSAVMSLADANPNASEEMLAKPAYYQAPMSGGGGVSGLVRPVQIR